MLGTILQSADPDWFEEYWQTGDWLGAALEPFIWLLGRPTFILLLTVPPTVGLWIQAESIIPPAIIITLFMGLILAGAPAGATIVMYIVVIIATLIAYRSITGVGKGI